MTPLELEVDIDDASLMKLMPDEEPLLDPEVPLVPLAPLLLAPPLVVVAVGTWPPKPVSSELHACDSMVVRAARTDRDRTWRSFIIPTV
jgi:hypothetical protein